MIACCSWCFAPIIIDDTTALELLSDGLLFPVCSDECGEALDAATNLEDEEGEQ